MKITVVNKAEVLAFLENLKKAKLTGAQNALFKAGTFVQGEVKSSIAGQRGELTSVDTGRFLNSVDVQTKDKETISVYSDIAYAKFLEYGTSKLEARNHFRNTAKRIKIEIKKIIAEGIH